MKQLVNIAIGAAIGCVACWAFIHRNAIAASIKGEPLPEPPAWHAWYPGMKK
jgi:hypothetical protein